MLMTWIRGRRDFRAKVREEADRLQAEHGRAAYATASIAARTVQGDWRFAQAVRDEVGRRIGYRRPANDPAPLYLAGAN